jgi:hypothetical protein
MFLNYSKKRWPLFIIGAILIIVGAVLFFTEALKEKENNWLPAGFGNDYQEKAITDYLLTQKQFSWQTKEGSHSVCSVENLGQDGGLFPLYVWAYCAEYTLEDGKLKTLSGSSGPIKINYPNELSYYDLSRFSYEAPGDGSHYTQDVRTMFPGDIQEIVFNFDRENIIEENEAAAWAWLTAGSNN